MKRAILLFLVLVCLLVASAYLGPDLAHATYKHPKKLNNAAANMVRVLKKEYRCCKAEIEAAKDLTYQESSWRNTCRTGSYVGLWQNDIRWHPMHHKRLWQNPAVNTRRAMKYIRKRYGTIRKALAHSRAHNWY
jgi:hypothetical protein